MKKILSVFLAVVIGVYCSCYFRVSADTSLIKVTKVSYINNGRDLSIQVNIKNTGTQALGGIYRVKIIILDKNNSLIVNNTFTDSILKAQIIQPGKSLDWRYILPNAKKGDVSKITWQAYLSWSGANMPVADSTAEAVKPQLKITKIEYTKDNSKLVVYGVFTNRGTKGYTNINNVTIKIYDKNKNLIANAKFNDKNLSSAKVDPKGQLNWLFKIGKPKIGDISIFTPETTLQYSYLK
jgi:hypothetical protein